MQLGIGQWVSRRAFLNGGRTALISNGAHITYADLDRRTNQVAAALIALGVRKGDRVKYREKIGEMGSSGRSTAPHLHYEVRVDDTPRDPMNFIQAGRYVFKR